MILKISLIISLYYKHNLNISGLDYEVRSPGDLKEDKYDVAVDCSGSGPAMESAIKLLTRGGRFCIFGVADPKTKISIEPFQVNLIFKSFLIK